MVKLTKREAQIAGLLITGASDREIAVELNLAGQTVRNHLHSVYRKAGVRGRLQLSLSFVNGGRVNPLVIKPRRIA